jgi:hypothetical protein
MNGFSHSRFIRLGALTVTVATVFVAIPSADADTGQRSGMRGTQISADALGATILTLSQVVGLLRLPSPGDWQKGDLHASETGTEVSANRSFSNAQARGAFTMVFSIVQSWTDAGVAAQTWNAGQEAAARQAAVTVLTRTAARSALYALGQYGQRSVTVNQLVGTWSVGATCVTNKPKTTVTMLKTCASKLAKAQQTKSAKAIGRV